MIAYADTSFLVSLYLPDAHSPMAWTAMKSRPFLYLTPLHELEFVNAWVQFIEAQIFAN